MACGALHAKHAAHREDVALLEHCFLIRDESNLPRTISSLEEEEIQQRSALRREIVRVLKKQKKPLSALTLKKHVPERLLAPSALSHCIKWAISLGEAKFDRVCGKSWRNANKCYLFKESSTLDPLEDCDRKLARWYFSLYQPSTLDDLLWWSGIAPVARMRNAFARLLDEQEIVPIDVKSEDGDASLQYVLKESLEKLKLLPNEIRMARFLPYEDAIVKGYKATRSRFYDSKFENNIITAGGESRPTVWFNGQIIGVWKWENKPRTPIYISLFEGYEDVKQSVEFKEELARLTQFLETSEVHFQ